MEIIIEDNLLYKEAMRQMQRQWFLLERRDGESFTALEKRVKTTRKTIRKVLGSEYITNDLQESGTNCLFCGSEENVEIHHTYGRTKNETIYLCRHCHRKFHGLNKRFNNKQD